MEKETKSETPEAKKAKLKEWLGEYFSAKESVEKSLNGANTESGLAVDEIYEKIVSLIEEIDPEAAKLLAAYSADPIKGSLGIPSPDTEKAMEDAVRKILGD